jgi:Domain of unknown function (DUF4266)
LARPSVTTERLVSRPPADGIRTLLAACAAALLLAALGGCSHVSPYEREHLAKPGMDPKEREALRTKFYAHVYEAREGAMPSEAQAGGGCGCN